MDFSGSRVVVTGASSGIGRAVASALASRGAEKVVVHYRKNLGGAEETAAEVAQFGCKAIVLKADITDADESVGFVNEAWQQLGFVTTWVNNAGADVLTGEAAEWNFDAKLRFLLETDVVGTIRLSRMVAERLTGQPSIELPPSITFIGWDQSSGGMEGDAGQMFGPVKAAVSAFAKSLAQTLSPRVRVNLVAPGWIRTAWGQSTSTYWNQRAASQSLMGRWGTPDDVARAVCFVADPANTFCTAQTITANGGWNRRPDHLT